MRSSSGARFTPLGISKLPERLHRELKARYWKILDEATSAADAKAGLLALAGDYRRACPSAMKVIDDHADELVAPCASRSSRSTAACVSAEASATLGIECWPVGDHLIVMHSAVRFCPGYSRHEAPSILMDGSSIARDTEHGRAVTAQLTRRHDTLEEALDAANFALAAADVTRAVRRQARAACEDYFYRRLDLVPDLMLSELPPVLDSLEPLPDDIRRALEDVVELVVDGDYDELRRLSRDSLAVEDLRRRVEDDVPEALVLPPPETYVVEAITPFDEPETPGWAYFLDLWIGEAPARLHIEGEIEEGPDGLLVTFTDILP